MGAAGRVRVVGLGPGGASGMTEQAAEALRACDVIAGYTGYVRLVGELAAGKEVLSTPMRREVERCRLALERAAAGADVAMVCSGDAGVYGMASLVLELAPDYSGVAVEVIPGVTAAQSGAALLGAPLGHDFATVSLSDALTSWEVIECRLRAAAQADFCLTLYNPRSIHRPDHLRRAVAVLIGAGKPAQTACGWARNIGRGGEECGTCTLAELADLDADMFTTAFVGNADTRVVAGRLVTPRGYRGVGPVSAACAGPALLCAGDPGRGEAGVADASGSSHRIDVVGMGPGDPDLLTVAGMHALQEADLVVGASRLLEALPDGCPARRVAAVGADAIVSALAPYGSEGKGMPDWRRAAVVVSGDVGLFSGARGLPERLREGLPGCDVRLIPGVSSLQLLAARLGRPWQDWHIASAHGVACDVAALARQACAQGAPLFLVTGGSSRAHDLCGRLATAGLGALRASVGERLGCPGERIASGTVAELAREKFDNLSVLLVEAPEPPCSDRNAPGDGGADGARACAPAPEDGAPSRGTASGPDAAPDSRWPWATPGIPDEAFVRGPVPMTKQEVRAVALAKLRLRANDTVWDVGAGTGSVSVEAALLASAGRVCAIEREASRADLVRENAELFGCANVEVTVGEAPAVLEALPVPDAVFVGGTGGGLEGILAAARVRNGRVRVCVTCVTLETLAEATRLLAGSGWTDFEACQVAVSRAEQAGAFHLMRAQNPVFVVSARGDAPAPDDVPAGPSACRMGTATEGASAPADTGLAPSKGLRFKGGAS